MKLVVGLGNPGPRYADNRHNIGFMVVERLAEQASIALKKKGHQGLYGVGRIAGQPVTLLLPQTFMNLSGASVGSAVKSLGIHPGDLIVVHDDLDLPFASVRIKTGGGHGGHNGIRHICQVLGHGDFVRIKLGIDRPRPGVDVAAYVLQGFAAEERSALNSVLETGTMAVETVLSTGAQAAMNQFNRRELSK